MRQPPRKRHDSDSSDGENSRKESRVMSSGHTAGLQHHKEFNEAERKIRKQKDEDAKKMVDKYGIGDTVYRDKEGKKKSKKSGVDDDDDTTVEQYRRLNQGTVQRIAEDAMVQEMAQLQNATFARMKDDKRLDQERKNEIRKDDPMARYALKKYHSNGNKDNNQTKFSKSSKPSYKGPPPKPNRFGIRPGYRWDGIVRSNGFEDKLLAKRFSSNRKEEEAYRWRSADM